MDKNFCSTLGGLLHVIVFPTFSGVVYKTKCLLDTKKNKMPIPWGLSFIL